MGYKQTIGMRGEIKACEYLTEKGYEIIEKNYRCKIGEVDIIARAKNKELVFVEVKTRSSINYGVPSEAVNYQKQTHIIRVAKYYILKNKLFSQAVRFDVIEIILGKTYFLHHIKQAFC